MISTRSLICLFALTATAVGCGGQAEPKKMPKDTPDTKATQDKAHEDAKKSADGGAKPAPAK